MSKWELVILSNEPTSTFTVDDDQLLKHVNSILASSAFKASKRNTDFLNYIIDNHRNGRDDLINGFCIGQTVFGKGANFDPHTDPIVRIQAGRLRKALKLFYFEEGDANDFRITIPLGSYVPSIVPIDKNNNVYGDDSHQEKQPIIAVLPFLSLSLEDKYNYIAQGITEELSLLLTAFEGFSVISSRSTQLFKAELSDISEIGRSLGASFILHGSVRGSDDQLRIIVEVLDCISGKCIWTERFDRNLSASNLFDLQDEITSEVVSKVADHYGVIPRKLSDGSKGRRTENLSSYEALLASYAYTNSGESKQHEKAISLLQSVTTKDPNYAPAWAHLSELTTDKYVLWCGEQEIGLESALKAAKTAVALDPNYQYAHFSKAYAHFFRKEYEDFRSEAEIALRLRPRSAFVSGFIGFLLALSGEWERGLEIIQRSKKLNPFHPNWFYLANVVHALSRGELEKAYEDTRNIRSPNIPWDYLLRAACLMMMGKKSEASIKFEELLEIRPELEFEKNRTKYIGFFVHDDDVANQITKALNQI